MQPEPGDAPEDGASFSRLVRPSPLITTVRPTELTSMEPDDVARSLVEHFPEQLVDRSWWHYVSSVGIPCGTFCFFPFLIAAIDSRQSEDGPMIWLAAPVLTGMLLTFGSLLIFSSASVLHRHLKANLPTVELRDDKITLRIGHHTKISSNISECRIRHGRAFWMRISAVPWGITVFFWDRVLLIDLPPIERSIVGNEYSRNTLAVGLAAESLVDWERALL